MGFGPGGGGRKEIGDGVRTHKNFGIFYYRASACDATQSAMLYSSICLSVRLSHMELRQHMNVVQAACVRVTMYPPTECPERTPFRSSESKNCEVLIAFI